MSKIKLTAVILITFLFKCPYIFASQNIHGIEHRNVPLHEKLKQQIIKDETAKKNAFIDAELKETNYQSLKQKLSQVQKEMTPIRKELISLKRMQKFGSTIDTNKLTHLQTRESELEKRETALQAQIDQIFQNVEKEADRLFPTIGIDAYIEHSKIIEQNARQKIKNITAENEILDKDLKNITAETETLEKDLKNITAETETLEKNLKNITAETETLEKNLKNTTAETETLEKNLKKAIAETEILNKNLKNTIAETEKREEDILKSREEDILWKNINQERRDRKNEELARINKEVEELQNQRIQRRSYNTDEIPLHNTNDENLLWSLTKKPFCAIIAFGGAAAAYFSRKNKDTTHPKHKEEDHIKNKK